MRNRSEAWARMAQGDFHFDSKLQVGEKLYTKITAPRIDRPLMSSPLSVGNCVSSSLSLSIMTDDELDPKVPITIKGRLSDIATKEATEWMPFGTYYINQKSIFGKLTTITCFDAMRRANQNYLADDDAGMGWPKHMHEVVSEIAYRIGVGIDERTLINIGDDYMVPCPTGKTMLQVLGYIGGVHCGNWIVTDENNLRLVPLVNVPTTYAAYDGTTTPESLIPAKTYYITDEAGLPIITRDDYNLVWAYSDRVDAEAGVVEVKSVMGALTTGIPVKIAGVYMSDESGNVFTAGNTTGTGIIKIESNPYANQSICTRLYNKFKNFIYAPFTAQQAVYDPAAELGDQVIYKDVVHSVLYSTVLTLDTGFRSDISAPNSEELTDEYPYLTEVKRLYQSTAALNADIKKTAEELKEQVENSGSDLSDLTQALSAEVKRASGVEQELNTRIGTEETRAKEAEQDLQAEIDAEETRAKAAEKALQDAVNALAGGDLVDMTADINALKAKDESHDTKIANLETNLTAEQTRATEAEEALQADITAEETRAKGAEETLQTNIDAQALLIQSLTDRLNQDEAAIADLTSRLAALEGNT